LSNIKPFFRDRLRLSHLPFYDLIPSFVIIKMMS